MSELNPESLSCPISPLAVDVLATTKNAYETLEGLRKSQDMSDLFKYEHNQPDVINLEAALGRFAEKHLEDGLDTIPQLSLPKEVTDSANQMLQRLLTRKLNWAIFDQYEKREAAAVTEMVGDKVIVATSLKYGHGHSDGYGVSSGSGHQRHNKTVIGKLLSVDPSLGQIWIGERNDCYQVDLWSIERDHDSHTDIGVRQQSTLEIIDAPTFDVSPRIGSMAVFATELDGLVPITFIEQGIMLETASRRVL
jgi:hypothetical protein